ncbi:MAG: hypothetical protein ACREP2_07240 [Rhodanobacteraceae bacterium]
MNIQKLVAITAAILINCAVLAWFHAQGAAVVANATPAPRAEAVLTLPTVTVYPTRAQIESLHRDPSRR